ncbi:MAG: lytic transglycosylase domain-containing protein [Firmicutes bacterium]|nr:lytic transglycosylase domain-containing protein [Bacillota bacterium]
MPKILVRILAFTILVSLVYMLIDSPLIGRIIYPLHYRELIEERAGQYDLDPALVAAVIKVESNFRADAVSRRGATGLMQLLPSTATWISEQMGLAVAAEEIEDLLVKPEFNLMLGTWYLNNLAREFDNDLPLVLAAYNAGRGKVRSWLEDDVWSGKMEDREQIPYPETRDYLGKVELAQGRYQRYYFSERGFFVGSGH